MKKNINIAIVGYGYIGQQHALSAYAANQKFNLPFWLNVSHVITKRPENLNLPNIKACENIDDVLADDNVDIIDICNINQAHLPIIDLAVKAQKAIYCEKPLTESLENSKTASELVEKSKIINSVALNYRFFPALHFLKNEILSEKLGNIIEFRSNFWHSSYLNPERRTKWRTQKGAGGGVSIDLSIHMIDALRFLFGEIIDAENTKKIHFPNVYEDEVSRHYLKMQNNVEGILESSRIFCSKNQSQEIVVFCENGNYKCDFTNPTKLEINIFGEGSFVKTIPVDFYKDFYPAVQTSGFLDSHASALSEIAKKVYYNTNDGLGADFEDAYIDQKYV